MSLPADYSERVYAGVLGKIIGVYLGRPFEGWSYEQILAELGEIDYYVHEKRRVPLIVPDDDISGTFTFLRALPDYGNSKDITPAQIGQTWLNYLIEKRTVLWWGGLGNSTEHTAYLRLKNGIPAPRSGSMELNTKVVAEQIGAQIFIDGWGMVAPGDPELAADLARRAASVSHDGEAIYGAQVIAAMEALAFYESNLDRLIDAAVALIPHDSVIYRLIAQLREWYAKEPDWHEARRLLALDYGYDKYGGNCHIVPNHGVVMLGLLYGQGDFQKSLLVTNTCGWDTDCNSGNVGCLVGIWKGLAGLEAGPDWRGPVADRLFLPTADGSRCITDAVQETDRIVNIGRALAGQEPVRAKQGARFHFDLPGAVQGFTESGEVKGLVTLENVLGHSKSGARALAIRFAHLATGRVARVATSTFIPPGYTSNSPYSLLASPTLYPGQNVSTRLSADADNTAAVLCTIFISIYTGKEQLTRLYGPVCKLLPGAEADLNWCIPDTERQPIAEIGYELTSATGKRVDGTVYLDYLTWTGVPQATFARPSDGGGLWLRAWTNGVDHFSGGKGDETYRLVQDSGVGLAIQGERDWVDYQVSAVMAPHMAKSAGLCARVQGMRRYYAALLCADGYMRLVKALDGERILAEAPVAWIADAQYEVRLTVAGNKLAVDLNGSPLFSVQDNENPLESGAIALLCEEGRVAFGPVTIGPLEYGK